MTRIDEATARRLGVNVPRADHASEPERALLTLLRYEGIVEPRTEYPFHETRKWRFDFAWPIMRVACEVEGGTYPMKQPDGSIRPGRHSHPATFERDAEKYNEAAILGWTVLRVTPHMIEDGRAVATIKRALDAVADRFAMPRKLTRAGADDD